MSIGLQARKLKLLGRPRVEPSAAPEPATEEERA